MQGISRRRFTLALCGLSLGGIPTAAATRPRSKWTSQQGDIAERILRREIESGIVPGIGYSIGNSEQSLAEGAFGLRRVSPQTPIDSETRFALASVSKQFAAACIFLLRDKGALSLDSPVGDYLPEYRHAQKMTLRQILTMRSGIPMDTTACERPVGIHMDIATLIENLNQRELDFSPGDHFAYSNCGYDVIGAVITRVSGTPYAEFVDEQLFRPLGMTSSYVLGSRDDPNFADGYVPEGSGWRPAPLTTAHRVYASGNLASNPGDMQRWHRSLLNATLLSRVSLLEMFAVPALASGAQTHYASGWFIEPQGAIWHGGVLEGYGSANLIVPASGHAITVLGNTKPGERWKPWRLAREIYNAASLGPTLPDFLPPVKTPAPP